MAWIGTAEQLFQGLRELECDTTIPEGDFCVDGQIVSFMGMGEEYVVGDEAVYYQDGKPRNLAAALNLLGRGLKVAVI